MATIARERPAKTSLAPEPIDQLLAAGAAVLFVAVLAAIARGRSEWHELSFILWAHILTIVVALGLTPLMLLRRRGDRMHRQLGWVWAASLALTAVLSFGVRGINQGGFSLIHILSAWTLIQVPLIVVSARRHQHARHRANVRGMVTGALLIAGFFTFPFNRLMGQWLFG